MACLCAKNEIDEGKKEGKIAVFGLYIRKSNDICCQALFKAK